MSNVGDDPAFCDDTCLIIPMFNEASSVGLVVEQARSRFERVVCVDDGSTDGSAAVAERAGARVVRHATNLGAGAAFQTGLTFALRDPANRYLVTLDADGQHDVGDAVRMVEHARSQRCDVVLGSRFLGNTTCMPRSRRVVLQAGVWFTRVLTGLPLTDTHNGLRVLNREAARHMQIRLNGMAHGSEILSQIARSNITFEEFPVTIHYTDYSRRKGQANINAINILFDLLCHRLRTAR